MKRQKGIHYWLILTGMYLVAFAAVGAVEKAGAADPSEPTLLRKTYESAFLGTDRDYWLSLPAGYDDDTEKQWPVIMFLHGGGERGNDLDLVLKHGPIMEVTTKKRDLPFVIIAPQMPAMPEDVQRSPRNRSRGGRPPGGRVPMVRKTTGAEPRWDRLGPPHGWHELEDDLLLILGQTFKEYRTDPDRVYLTGLSYGGFGTWYMATNHADRFAAVAPICGAGQPDEVHRIGQLPVWLFQGGRDSVVLVEWSVATADALDEAGGNVRVTVHEDLAHNCWTRAYEGEDLYHWFLSHKRGETGGEE